MFYHYIAPFLNTLRSKLCTRTKWSFFSLINSDSDKLLYAGTVSFAFTVMNSFSSPFHSSIFRLVLQHAGLSWRAEGNLNWHTSSFLASHPRRKKELQLFIFQIKSLAKPASTKQPFHPFSHQSDRFQRVTVKSGRSFMQLCICNQALCVWEDRTGL